MESGGRGVYLSSGSVQSDSCMDSLVEEETNGSTWFDDSNMDESSSVGSERMCGFGVDIVGGRRVVVVVGDGDGDGEWI